MKKDLGKVYFRLILIFLLLISLWTGASTDIVNAISLPVAGFSKALDFSTDRRIDIPNNASTRLAGNSDFTVSMWIYPEAETGCRTLYRQSGASGALGVWLRYDYDDASGKGYLYYGFDKLGTGWQWSWPWGTLPEEVTKFPLNQWTHVALTKSGNSVKTYVNGVVDYEMTLDAIHSGAPAPLTGGISVGGDSGNYFDGCIDEIRFWNTGLDQNKISSWMYREIDDTHPNYENLVVNYRLNQSSGAVVEDTRITDNNGTAINITDGNWIPSDIRGWTVNAGTTLSGKLVGSHDMGTSTNGYDWNLTFEIVDQGSKGTAAVTGDNQFTYTVDTDQEGSDSFTYRVRNADSNYSNTQTVDINIIPVKVISGNAGVAEAILSYNDGSDKTVTADGTGVYSFLVPSNWSGTVTPSKAGYTFTPANMAYTNVLADQASQDYTATAITYSVDSISNQTMAPLTAGYGAGTQETKTITITRTGAGDLVNLAAALSGANAGDFEITQPLVTTLNDGVPNTTFTVKARDGLAAGTYTATVTVSADNMAHETFAVTQVVNPLSSPVLQSANAGDSQVSIIWNSVDGATEYRIFQSTTSGSYGAAIATVDNTVSSYDATGLTNGTTYYFVVKTIVGASESVNSNEMNATPQVPAPGAPVLLSAVAGDGYVNITWNTVPGSTGYKIYASTTSGSYTLPADTVAGGVSSTDVEGLVNGTTYCFVVKATNPGGDSAASNEISAVPQSVPGAPTNVTAVAGNGEATVSFTAPADNGGSPITGYVVTSDPDNITATGIATTITVTGLTNGTAYTFSVQASNGVGYGMASAASNAVTPYSPSSGGDSDSGSSSQAGGVGTEILINGKREIAATAQTTTIENRTVMTVTVNNAIVEEKLQQEGDYTVVTIPVKDEADDIVSQLNGLTVKNMENKEAVLEIKTEGVTYTLPASQINIDSVSQQIGEETELQDIAVNIRVSSPPQDVVEVVEDVAKENNYQIIVEPVTFEINCTNGDKTIDVSRFNAYVERIVAIPDGIDPHKITTGIVVNTDGTFSHVPTVITVIDGKYYAKISSLTNSTYSVIYHPLEFKDVFKHWARVAVDDMGARLVIDALGNGYFEPDGDITKAEFTAVVVRALGLMQPGTGKDIFNDVTKDAWYYDGVSIAYEYGIISGNDNGEFEPLDKITRGQAMAMIASAMRITGLEAKLSEDEADKLLAGFYDAKETADDAKNSTAECIKTGIVIGRNGKLLAPKDNLTRAEAAVVVRRLLQVSKLI